MLLDCVVPDAAGWLILTFRSGESRDQKARQAAAPTLVSVNCLLTGSAISQVTIGTWRPPVDYCRRLSVHTASGFVGIGLLMERTLLLPALPLGMDPG